MERKINVLIACEESQAVCKAFRALGFEAYSCDIIEPSGGKPEWHIKQDVLPLINGNCKFRTLDGVEHEIAGKWDLIIAHPPCTNLAVSGMRWFKEGRKPYYLIDEASDFFMKFVNADCDRIAIENPVCVMSSRYRKPDQIINPWQFGHPEQKKTCLWLKGLPKLIPTNVVNPPARVKFASGKTMAKWYADAWHLSKEERSRLRSQTFSGIAEAMVQQWGCLLNG